MTGQPLISIVTPSFNQGRYLRETLDSLVAQNYSNLEVIIQDGGSTDGAVAVAQEFVARFPAIFQLFVEKDRGQADALNRGFARTTGEILGFLNSDDTLFPGCLGSVAKAIDPGRNRLVVMGRCLFTGENSAYVGVEHPCSFESHFEQLAIWKRGYNTIPQPSVFWHRKAWEEDAGFDVTEQHAIDYELFCRMSRRHRFHKIDELWSTYRMHPVSKSFQRSEAEILDLSIRISRRHWGSWLSPTRWRCEISYWLHGRNRHEKARHHARRCEEAAGEKRRGRAFYEFLNTAIHSPRMARDRLLVPFAGAQGLVLLQKILINPDGGFAGRHDADLWIGPWYRQEMSVPADAVRLVLYVQHSPQGEHHAKVNVTFRLNRTTISKRQFTLPGQGTLEADVRQFQGRKCVVEIQSDRYFVPRMVHGVPDDRRLSLQLMDTRFETVADESTAREEHDRWIGPLYRQEMLVPATSRRLAVFLRHIPTGENHRKVRTNLLVDRKAVASGTYVEAGRYVLEADLDDLQGRVCVVELCSDAFHTGPAGQKRSMQLLELRTDATKPGFFGRYEADSYVGPHYRRELTVPARAIRLTLVLEHIHQGSTYCRVNVTLCIDGTTVDTAECREAGRYFLKADLRSLRGKDCIVELRSDNFFVPRAVHNAPDDRLLSVKLIDSRIDPSDPEFTGIYPEDSYVGPHFRHEFVRPAQASRVTVTVRHSHHGDRYREVNTSLLIDGSVMAEQHCTAPGDYVLTADLGPSAESRCIMELHADNFFVPEEVHQVPDRRKLSLQLIENKITLLERAES